MSVDRFSKKNLKSLVVMFVILVTGFTAGAYAYRNKSAPLIDTGGVTQTEAESGTKPIPAAGKPGYMEFSSPKYGFSITYPQELGQVSDFDEQNGAHTIVFEGGEGGRGFQIYVQPYLETSIGKEKFKQDAPSGVMIDPIEVVIGGERAQAFYGRVDGFGDTREVWFIHGGYLFEVTTNKEFDAYLAEIMKTWKFQN